MLYSFITDKGIIPKSIDKYIHYVGFASHKCLTFSGYSYVASKFCRHEWLILQSQFEDYIIILVMGNSYFRDIPLDVVCVSIIH